MQVVHFVPWSRYPADIGQNFVVAHERCNSAKSDHLAAEVHPASWAERNKLRHAALEQRLKDATLPSDPLASVQIAKWVYQQTEAAKGQVWVREKVLQHPGSGWIVHLPL